MPSTRSPNTYDMWMARYFRGLRFERFCDDIVVHCVSEQQARYVGQRVAARLAECGLRLHPDKTRVVFCPQDGRVGSAEHNSFTFLGYTFRQRTARRKGGSSFNGFLPAASKDAVRKMSRVVKSWRLHRRTTMSLDELAALVNQIVPGWLNYYGRFYPSVVKPILRRINAYLLRWARKKYKRLQSLKRALAWWNGVVTRAPTLFTHWKWTTSAWMTG